MGHCLGSLLPRVDPLTNQPIPAKFPQIYIVDTDMQQRAERRRGIFADGDPGTLLDIEQMMTEVNPFAQQFLNFAERLRQDEAEGNDVVDMVYRLHEKRSNPRTYNLPTVPEVYATLIEDGNLECPRDILLWAKDHNLLRLSESNPMYDPLQVIIDKLASAELPDPDTNSQLYETILTCMMHGPCGAANPSCACMKVGKCIKGDPKPLAEVTQGNVNGFPVFRRRLRPPGVLKFKGRDYDNATINQWVVPYNPYLSQKYNCHINVEVCTTLTVSLQVRVQGIRQGGDYNGDCAR
ncbi:unnamed protein product [Phytophthora fragariaefolia]|uniref:Unnamed protein product n=1 Tax=Phytophthora fragariaefolia TaxID=1490495 RepID=A0A9W6XW43_9STRA|nr:unnamed protein product [Phytophthora fragariaefolia]